MSGGKSKKQTSTQTTVRTPPGYLNEEYQFATDEIRKNYEDGNAPYYPGNMIADWDPAQLEAADRTLSMARDGSPLVRGAQGLIQDTLDGKYMTGAGGGNPYLDKLLAQYGAKANAATMSNFNKAGRTGSGANAAAAGKAITDATLPYLFDQYNTDMSNRYQAAQLAPGLAEQDYIDANRIAAVGDARQTMGQNRINADVAKYEYETGADDANLDEYLQRIYTHPGANFGTDTATSVSKSSGGGLGSVLGTALSLGSMFVPGGQFAGMGLGLGGGLSSMLSSAGLANTMLGRSIGGFSGASTPLSGGGAINWLR